MSAPHVSCRNVRMPNVAAPVLGLDDAREELREVMFRANLTPDCHPAWQHRQMLLGLRPLYVICLLGMLARIIRRGSRETVRRVLDLLIGPLGFVAADAPERQTAILKSVDDEQFEAYRVGSKFHSTVDLAQQTGDPLTIREAKREGDRLVAEVRDVQRAIGAGR